MSHESNLPDKPEVLNILKAEQQSPPPGRNVQLSRTQFSGPIPPPEFLAHYDACTSYLGKYGRRTGYFGWPRARLPTAG